MTTVLCNAFLIQSTVCVCMCVCVYVCMHVCVAVIMCSIYIGEVSIVLSSDEDSVPTAHQVTNHQDVTEHSNADRKKKKKRKFISPQTLFKGAK